MANNIERRQYTRIKVRWPIIILTDKSTIEGETRDISAAGMFINGKEPLQLNQTYQISVMPPNHHNIDLGCKVIWSHSYTTDGENIFGMGFCFVKVSEEDRNFLGDLLSINYK